MLRIELLLDIKTDLGEGPLWDAEEENLYFVDIFGRRIHRCDAAGGDLRSWNVPADIGAMALRRSGGAVLALATGFHALDFETGECTSIADPESDKPANRFNDGKVDRQGRFVAGSMDTEEEAPSGKLYRLDPDYSLKVLDTKIVVSNGPCWSRDGRTLYFADSFRRTIYAYDYDLETGTASRKRPLVDFQVLGQRGFPDGATVDEEDCLWCVAFLAGQLLRFDPEGRLDRVVGLPVACSTSLTFGGPGLDVAYLTTMALPLAGAAPKEREAGGLFAIHGLGVRGLPEPRFAG